MTIRSAQETLVSTLKSIYDERESANIADWVLEHLTGKKRVDRIVNKDESLSGEQEAKLLVYNQELSTHRPVQYVLGEAWFAGMRFFVNENVLIPRPETEELVNWILSEIQTPGATLLDIGTGSGCIPIATGKKNEQLSVTALDISEAALQVAQQNANDLSVPVDFIHADFLDEKTWPSLGMFTVITSNPPYIKESERQTMSPNVLDFEPSTALFVPDNDPLIFYRKIATFASTHLSKNGTIFLEINEALGKEVTELFTNKGYSVELRKDMQEKDRMMRIY